MDKERYKKLLKFLESSDGRDVDHEMVKSGPLAGQTAIGEYAMMPETIQEMAKQNMRTNADTPVDSIIRGVDPKNKAGFEEVMEDNPHKLNEYTDMYVNKVIDKSSNEPEAATKWFTGPGAAKETVKKADMSDEGMKRANKYKQFMDRYNKSEPTPEVEPFPGELPQDVIMSRPRPKLRGLK